MPFTPPRLIKPKKFLQHKGRSIYHTYRDDELEGGTLTFTYTTSLDDTDIDWQFDVRELPAWARSPFPSSPLDYKGPKGTFTSEELRHIRKVIKQAIDSGEIPFHDLP